MATSRLVQQTFALGRTPFKTFDPFLFNMYHLDNFPAAEGETMAPPRELLRGRQIGSDFSYTDGWSMYHGDRVPGFPVHPHRGFETITIVRKGLIDHSDSIGCTARYGDGDTQWMTAGAGIQHAEMFPLLKSDARNPADLFQVWLNLPKRSKFVPPAFTMMWAEKTPIVSLPDESGDASGKVAKVRLIAGTIGGVQALPPTPHSFAAQADSDVAVWVITIPEGVRVTLPPATAPTANRAIYYVGGDELLLSSGGTDTSTIGHRTGAKVDATRPLTLTSVKGEADLILLQGRPIGEPVAQHGPFVMNTQEEIYQCFEDFQKTRFGGWTWPSGAPVHAHNVKRHAVHPDGHREEPV